MKKIITSTFLLANLFSFAQQSIVSQNTPVSSNQGIYYTLQSASGKTLSYDDILGTPYPDKNFVKSKISGTSDQQTLVRYNSYNDEIEFKKDDKVLALPKSQEYGRIEIASPKQTLVLLDTSDELSGYFYELANGKNTLYKKVKTRFIDFVPAPNGYASDKPATFKTLDPVYYIKTEKGFIKKPKNQKEIIEQFSDKKEPLTTFFKSNKIKFDKDEDLIKLVTFLNQN
ncbi:hypothetical protein C1637_03965 [Chryseobacterium lactis]|uniref:GLPGLI family protein n=1 Tax=Chryseobacterium lactis TaxID=1241981 RepID=A0A3G6RYS6_CHRLC|nr:hypothetical protein [Chryseobacterium lactis]AZA81742.1 hypothetical protein EG342_07360 [Chryseobacterium lactis]AZB06740.1 hypothetical protein EG341_23480 [Chryseobacterium lactis]PNW15591.1 hypothetical protein C1637_03965 [Chryseobacterium lactis]